MSDLRAPIGVFFGVIGIILLLTSWLSTKAAPLGSEHVNLFAGLAMLAFASVMLWLARRAR